MTGRDAKLIVGSQVLARQVPELPEALREMHLRLFGVPALVRLDSGECVRASEWLPGAVEKVMEYESAPKQ